MKYGKVAILAGRGDLPALVAKELQESGNEVFFVLFTNFAKEQKEIYKDFAVEVLPSIGYVGKLFDFMNNNQIKHVVFAGGIDRPSFSVLTKRDEKGNELIKEILKHNFLGDDKLLTTVINFFYENGFEVIDISKIIKASMAKKGYLGKYEIEDKGYFGDIRLGKKAIAALGKLDMGQSAVIQNGVILGVEGREGTAQLIERCGQIKLQGRKPILIKMKKKKQTRKADLPSVGIHTIEGLSRNGYAGMVLEKGSVIIINKKEVQDKADSEGVFVLGI